MSRRALFGVIVSLIIIGGRGLSATTSPVASVHLTGGWATFGQAVPQGLAFDGLKVGSLDTQTDVKNRWPDGSIKFAVLTAQAPFEDDYAIAASPPEAGDFAPDPRKVSVEMSINGSPHIAVAPVVGGDFWLRGPLVRETRHVMAPETAGGVAHPFLRINFDIRTYRDGDQRVDVSFENMLDKVGATTVTYDATILVGDVPAFSRTGIEHFYLTRWRHTQEFGTFAVEVTPDIASLNTTKALPPYLPLVSNVVNTVGPTFDILKEGALNPYMPAHSGRPELAPYPDWTARYLVHKNPDQKRFVLANGDLSGSWPIHVREPEDGTSAHAGIGPENLVSLDLRPWVWLDERAPDLAADGIDSVRGTPLPPLMGTEEPVPPQSPLNPDNNHQPSIAYAPYLLTGDRYYAEEMAFWANYALMKTSPESGQRNFDELGSGADGILGNNNETRGTAWALRNLVDAAAYYPDGLVRNYLGEKVANNLQWLDDYVNNQPSTNPLKIPWIGFRPEPGMVAMWEMSYVAWAIDRANKQGFAGGLAHRDVIAKLQLDLFRNTPAYPRTSILTEDLDFNNINGQFYSAGTEIPWGAPFTLQVAQFTGDPGDPGSWWRPENHATFTTLDQIGAATQADPFNHRPYAGFYGPEARLNLMMGVEEGWAGAQDAYDYLYQFIGTNDAACGFFGDDRPDLACRAGWALDFYTPYTPPTGGDDADGDGFNDAVDNCPAVSNANQINTDGDAFGDACDTDDDGDGVLDVNDAFPLNPSESVDTDHDGIGNNADTDDDGDGALDTVDAFPLDPAEKTDTDHDGIGNNADTDDDGDGALDTVDAFPLNPAEQTDTDHDGIGNNADPDDDNDGRLDGVDPLPLVANRAPMVTTPAPPPATVGVFVTLTLNATDADGDPLTYTATGLPGGLSLPPGSKVISGTPNTPGNFTVMVKASDGILSSSKTFTWVVDTPDDPIVLNNPGPQTSTEDQWVSLKLVWTSTVMKHRKHKPDLRPAHFEASGLPQALHIHQDGTISGNVGKKVAGVYNVTVTLRVGKQTVSQQFTWTILDANRAPRLRNIGDQSSKVGASARLVLSASDPDGDSLTFTVSGLPPGLSMSGGVISGTVGGAAKEYRVTVTVSDGKLSESETFSWNVTAVKKEEPKKEEPKKDDKGKK